MLRFSCNLQAPVARCIGGGVRSGGCLPGELGRCCFLLPAAAAFLTGPPPLGSPSDGNSGGVSARLPAPPPTGMSSCATAGGCGGRCGGCCGGGVVAAPF